MKLRLTIIATIAMLFLHGCSGTQLNPVVEGINSSIDYPGLNLSRVNSPDNLTESVFFAGAFHLEIRADANNAILTPIRDLYLGEAFIVSGKSYFTTFPCRDCLRIKSVALDSNENIEIGFKIDHPFDKGNPGLPPSGKNRLDLDVFDIALLVEPVGKVPEHYALTDCDIYTQVLENPHGYSGDLGNAMPYVICYESSNNNRFEMGTKDHEFAVTFLKPGLSFNLYLTMGYGASATFTERLNPVYYVPEFNRKSAWKIDVTAPIWDSNEFETVTIDIYDWNHGATVSSNFPDETHTDHISAPSDISMVTVEVPGMTNSIVTATTTDTTTNGWDDPLTYTAVFANENNLPDGEYIGLVKVTDSRVPGSAGGTDSLVVSPDGKNLEYFELDEFATYQTFIAKISAMHWTRTWGGVAWDIGDCVFVDNDGDIYICGEFSQVVDFDPGTEEDIHVAFGAWPDAFVIKMDPLGNYIWGKSWGFGEWDGSFRVVVDDAKNVYITGFFQSIVDFDPGTGSFYKSSNGNEDIFLLKLDENGDFVYVLTWGGIYSDYGYGITLSGSYLYTTGYFTHNVDFDTGSGTDNHSSVSGSQDIFVSKHDTDGNYIWARTWGGQGWDMGFNVDIGESDYVYVAGSFADTVDFDPGTGEDFHTGVVYDAFLSKFNPNGDFIWARTWGADGWDESYDLVCDKNQYTYVTGAFDGEVDFDPGTGIDLHTSDEDDAFLSKFNNTGDFIWAVTWGGPSGQYGDAIRRDTFGNLLISGDFEDSTDFDPGTGAVQRDSHGINDIYVSKFDANGIFQWVYTWGGTGSDGGWGVATDSQNHVIVTGGFRDEVDFDIGYGQDLRTSNGDYDCFLLKFLMD